MKRSADCARRRSPCCRQRKKTGRLDLEAIEMAVRSALHRAGAAALTELLQFPAPAEFEQNGGRIQ
ncbi:MAG TPA: hypothetical protein VLH09_00885 [Bryobacteraceae bacterium]|nr:hypothetical protein [Bryobacteraceae bacterium]